MPDRASKNNAGDGIDSLTSASGARPGPVQFRHRFTNHERRRYR